MVVKRVHKKTLRKSKRHGKTLKQMGGGWSWSKKKLVQTTAHTSNNVTRITKTLETLLSKKKKTLEKIEDKKKEDIQRIDREYNDSKYILEQKIKEEMIKVFNNDTTIEINIGDESYSLTMLRGNDNNNNNASLFDNNGESNANA
jgi:thiamine pyrophosphate-dependent acetolactate synthase large subunit-like protein